MISYLIIAFIQFWSILSQKGCSLGTLESGVKWTQLTTLTLGASGTAAQRQSDKQDSCRGENHKQEKAQATNSNSESSQFKLQELLLNEVCGVPS